MRGLRRAATLSPCSRSRTLGAHTPMKGARTNTRLRLTSSLLTIGVTVIAAGLLAAAAHSGP
jgi:hypothetical protein